MSVPGKYGEPWVAALRADKIVSAIPADPYPMRIPGGVVVAESMQTDRRDRAIAAVNACAGLDIPADAPLGWLAQRLAALEVVAGYAKHAGDCYSFAGFEADPCDCGLDKALASLHSLTTTNPDATP